MQIGEGSSLQADIPLCHDVVQVGGDWDDLIALHVDPDPSVGFAQRALPECGARHVKASDHARARESERARSHLVDERLEV